MKRCSRPAAVGVAVVLAASAAAAGGCTGSRNESPGPSATTRAAAPTPTTATAGEVTVLSDGRHPVFIVSVDDVRRTMVVDEVQFLTGAAAAKAAAEDGRESPPPNDYYIRNQNPRKRTVPVAEGARITVNGLTEEETGSATKSVPLELGELASYFPNPEHPLFWVTVEAGQALRVEQQYLP